MDISGSSLLEQPTSNWSCIAEFAPEHPHEDRYRLQEWRHPRDRYRYLAFGRRNRLIRREEVRFGVISSQLLAR